jgi:hypothetical protein
VENISHGQELRRLSKQIERMQERLEVIIATLDMQARDRAATQAAIDRMMRAHNMSENARPHLTPVKP